MPLSSVARCPFFHPDMDDTALYDPTDRWYDRFGFGRCIVVGFEMPLEHEPLDLERIRSYLRSLPDMGLWLMLDVERTTFDQRYGKKRDIQYALATPSASQPDGWKEFLLGRLKLAVELCREERPEDLVGIYGSPTTNGNHQLPRNNWVRGELETWNGLLRYLDFVCPTVYAIKRDHPHYDGWMLGVTRAVQLANMMPQASIPIIRARYGEDYSLIPIEHFEELAGELYALGVDDLNLWEQDYHSWYNARSDERSISESHKSQWRTEFSKENVPPTPEEPDASLRMHQHALWWSRYQSLPRIKSQTQTTLHEINLLV